MVSLSIFFVECLCCISSPKSFKNPFNNLIKAEPFKSSLSSCLSFPNNILILA